MKRRLFYQTALVLACMAGAALNFGAAQTQQPPAEPAKQAAPAYQGPRVKSQAEAQALQAIGQAQTPDERIKAGMALLEKFSDTEFKAVVLQIIAASYQQKNDIPNTIVFAERTLEADPKNYNAMLMLATAITQSTREFDLDREEKLARAEKYISKALELIDAAPKPNPNLTDQQWEDAKKDMKSQAYEARAMAAMARKNYPAAIAEFKKSIEVAAVPDPATKVRLGNAYTLAGQYDNAVAVLDEVLNTPNLHPTIKAVAEAEKARALQAKSGGAKPSASGPAAGAPPEAKKQ